MDRIMPKLCPDCGEDHDMLFSPRVLDLYYVILQTEDPVQRAELMLEMGETFVGDIDDTDEDLGEDIHEMIGHVIQNRMSYERSVMLLARVMMRSLPSYHPNVETEVPAGPGPSSDAN
jgi:hypothetical protein